MNTPNKLEMGVIKLIIARVKSKSPAMYATLTRLAVVAVALTGGYIGLYSGGVLPAHFVLFGHFDTGSIDNICVVIGAAATSLGLVSATTTTDATLIAPEVKKNVVDQAVSEGTHIPCDDTSNRGNDTN